MRLVHKDTAHHYSVPVLPGHWMIIDGTYFVSMHHLIDWTAHSERLKLPSPLSAFTTVALALLYTHQVNTGDQGVHLAALQVDDTSFDWVFVGVGTPRSEGALQFQPPAKFRQDATVWIPLHYDDNFFQYFSFHPETLSHLETLSPGEYFQVYSPSIDICIVLTL